MTLHALAQWLSYTLVAKGRHGTHSPFVYDFVEQVTQSPLTTALPGGKYERLLRRIEQHYQVEVILLPQDPADWHDQVSHHLPALARGCFIALPHIHRSSAHTRTWDELCNNTAVKMSLDLYDIGLLLSRPEFKEKQYFVVKY